MLEELADVVLDLALLGSQYLLFTLTSVFLFVVFDDKALVLYLSDSELSESLLIGLYVVQNRTVFYLIEDGVFVKEIGLFKA